MEKSMSDGAKNKKRVRKIREDNSLESLPEKIVRVQPRLPFSVWFNRMEKNGKVRFWQEDPLLIFMKKQGLSDVETEDKYSEAFKRF